MLQPALAMAGAGGPGHHVTVVIIQTQHSGYTAEPSVGKMPQEVPLLMQPLSHPESPPPGQVKGLALRGANAWKEA